MKAIVFLGPTLALDAAREIFDAEYRGPARQGDVLRALHDAPDAIGIIDGLFELVPSVWHKEILVALSRGVRVYGASSMGALRAAELHPFGMIGVGQVFEWYKSGALEDDDEVAIAHAHAEAGFRELSDAMVNLRDLAASAEAEGILTDSDAAKLIALAKGLHYTDRSIRRVLELARQNGLAEETLSAVSALAKRRVPLKRRDAIEMLERMRRAEDSAPEPLHLEHTIFLDRLSSEIDREIAERAVPGATLDRPRLVDVEKRVLLRKLALRELERLGISVSPAEVKAMADDFRRARGLLDPEQVQELLAAEGLTLERFAAVMHDLAAVRMVERLYAAEIQLGAPDHVRVMAGVSDLQARKGGGSGH